MTADGFMVKYMNNQKQVHYYRSLKCNGVSLNAFTTERANRRCANDLFLDLLNRSMVSAEIAPLVKTQLIKIFNHFNDGKLDNEKRLQSQFNVIERKSKDLKIRHGLNEIRR